jgi:HSP90 family molecular chaperone
MKKQIAEFKFSPRILDHLGISAYNSIRKCLAELCCNSYDADAMNVSITVPDAITKDAVIFIEDDGDGMSFNDIKDKYLFIGYNRREERDITDLGRPVIGSKGIGKLAGFGIARNIKVVSWKDGFQSTVVLDRDMFEDLGTINDVGLEVLSEKTRKDHGTKVILRNLDENLRIPDDAGLRA